MDTALNKTLGALPDDTKVYPGHEYTKANVKFAVAVSQSEPIKKLEAFASSNKQTQGKFTIGDEKQHNVFMRLDVRYQRRLVCDTQVLGSDRAEVYRKDRQSRCHVCPSRGKELHSPNLELRDAHVVSNLLAIVGPVAQSQVLHNKGLNRQV
ncbi:Cytoplasmic glyoxalase II [Friedmanniomyces endolithicus]|nr:Cytoplasmic glyoxalase II [Friedmanniomyces endolithicus]